MNFDETMAVLRQLHVGTYVSVHLFSVYGVPTMSIHGWCVRLEERKNNFALVIRDDRSDAAPSTERLANTLRITREGFRRAGESMDAEDHGPLEIEFDDLRAIVAMRDQVPDWTAIQRAT